MDGVFSPEKMAQTVFNLAKDYTSNTMQMMKTSTEHYEKTLDTLVKQGLVMQAEGQKLFMDWMTQVKQGQQQYWNLMSESLKKVEPFFSPDIQKKAAKQ